MTERKTMDLEGLPAPALGVEERSDEAPSAGVKTAPNPEVVAKPKRRQFTAEYRLRILEEADRCTGSGEVGQVLRREGLYSSHLANWRKARDEGALRGLRSRKRGVKPKASDPLESKVRELEAKVARLEKDLHKAHIILDVQEKVAGLLGFSLKDGKDC
jgi:transposase